MKTAILTDSTCNLSKDYLLNNKNIFVLPLNISMDGKIFKDQIEISSSEVYEKLDAHDVKTSLSNVGDVEEIIESIKNKGYEKLLIINLSSNLSGTHNVFRLVATETKGIEIALYDSKTLGMGLGYLVMEANKMIDNGLELNEIVTNLDDIRFNKMITIFSIETLKYLKAGGRIGKVEGTIADILRIKPIICVGDDGIYYTRVKARGNNRALTKLVDVLLEKYHSKKINLTVHYGNNLEKAQKFLNRLKLELNVNEIDICEITPVLGVHTGPGIIGVAAYEID
ncbi:DegV family protein [Mycoplasmatota bacterium]|nr:DegV family protein [Mycoplasmatota bacterium]